MLRSLPDPVPATALKPKRNKSKILSFQALNELQKFLHSRRVVDMDPNGHTRWEQLLFAVFEAATNPRHPQQIAAATFLSDRAHGKPKPSDEEIDAISKGGLQIVYVARPELDSDIQPATDALPPVPDFIDAEFTEETK